MKRRTHRSSWVDPAWSLVVADLRYLYAYSHVYYIIMDFVSQSDLLLIPYLLRDSTSAHTCTPICTEVVVPKWSAHVPKWSCTELVLPLQIVTEPPCRFTAELEPGHGSPGQWLCPGRVGSKLFSYRPGILTRFLIEQRNDTASVYMLGTHVCVCVCVCVNACKVGAQCVRWRSLASGS